MRKSQLDDDLEIGLEELREAEESPLDSLSVRRVYDPRHSFSLLLSKGHGETCFSAGRAPVGYGSTATVVALEQVGSLPAGNDSTSGECLWPSEKLSVEEISPRLLLEYLI